MIEIKNISCGYKNTTIVHNITFTIGEGKICGLIGANGAGKSTLFKCIMGYIKPNPGGSIEISGESILSMDERKLAQKIAYIPQRQDVAFSFSVLEMVVMGRTPHMGGAFGPSKDDYDICQRELNNVGMAEYANKSFLELSGGQQQLVILARAFAQDTPVLLLDEPTSNLDYKNQIIFWKTIKKCADRGKTVLVCVHDPNHVLWFCQEVIALGENGRIIKTGTAKEVLTENTLEKIYSTSIQVVNTKDMAVTIPKLI